jgi:hypothetical protein
MGDLTVTVKRTISAASEVGEIELNLIPSVVKTHWHRADEWLHSCCRLHRNLASLTRSSRAEWNDNPASHRYACR